MRVAHFALLAGVFSSVSGRVLHQLVGRASADVCASLSTAPLKVKVGSVTVNLGSISACICLGQVIDFVESNTVAKAAVAIVGKASVIAAVTSLINSAPNHKTCLYPDNLDRAVCTPSNVCGFTCKNGFTPQPATLPTTCGCPAPKIVCNGACISAAACPSPRPVKRDLNYARKNGVCDAGLMACEVYGARSSHQAWECVDTESDLESCGGCVAPLSEGYSEGTDCTAIQGVSDVSCVSGSCIVGRCLAGYIPSADRRTCIREAELEEDLDDSILALSYGLEHVPLAKKDVQ
ncbi:hypothetical protein BXZ70DRAFT_1042305 [Cristinia sonorae]|uniref:Protein CPL1-like domain-containing protein n=1 Tax=Cristinia sonorae TaxID=1940300 RepID=A0A8K0XLX1_9AGAR|nr:hypothetical protein BXZ70DRAFT_1042305 [Cristinia sonorae]